MTRPAVTQAFRGGGPGGAAGWWFAAEYDEDAIAAFKGDVPPGHRSWDEAEKRWWVSVEMVDKAFGAFPGLEAYTRQEPLL